MNFIRVGVVLVGVVAAAASATAPAKHNVERATTVPRDFEATWTAVIDLFAERGWAIDNLDKSSGIITTDWMDLGDQLDMYTDCGGSGITSVRATGIRFNVRVKPGSGGTELTVNATFRQLRSLEGTSRFVDCNSRGTVEAMIHDRIRTLTGTRPPGAVGAPNPRNLPNLAVAYWCSTSDGVCSADESACQGLCYKTADVWCSIHVEEGEHRFLCGMTRDGCLGLRDTITHRRRRSGSGECIKLKATGKPLPAAVAKRPPPPQPPPPPPAVPAASAPPRGFYCSSSAATPAGGFCTRDKAICQSARDAAMAAVTDLTACQLVESAFCFVADGTERCSPTAVACGSRASSTRNVTAPCDEQK